MNVQDKTEATLYEEVNVNEGISLAPCEAYGIPYIKGQ